MAQVPVELPDPTLTPTVEASASTDDLLAQLAGDEIDRLLAESDVAPEKSGESGHADATSTSAALGDIQTGDASGSGSNGHVGSSSSIESSDASPATQAMEQAEAELEGELDQLLNNLDKKTPAPASSVPPVEGEVLAEISVPAMASPADLSHSSTDALASPADRETGAAERSALAPIESIDLGPVGAHPSPRRTPLVLKPLVWINAPFGHVSDRTRSVLGKAAILTLINSAAVIGYVLVFRKH